MLRTKEAPYLLTIMITILSWLFTRAIDDITKSPLVVYDLQDKVNVHGEREFVVRVHNISRTTAFRELYVVLTNLDGIRSKFTNATVQYEPPVHVSKERKTSAEWGETWAGVLLRELQPSTAVRLVADVDGPDVPTVRCESQSDTVRLVRESWQTWIVEDEMGILISIAAVLAALIVFYVLYLPKSP